MDNNFVYHLGESSVFAGNEKSGDKDGLIQQASFYSHQGITIDEFEGSIFIADSSNHKIRKITKTGTSSLSLYLPSSFPSPFPSLFPSPFS